jgi:hypothetical protein
MTILVATWGDGLFVVTGDGRAQEVANQPVRGVTPDGLGGALAIVDRFSLRRRLRSGEWATVATSEFELSCCMAVRDTIYVGTDNARMLWLTDGASALDPIDSFEDVEGGMPPWTEGIVDTGCIAANGSSIAVADRAGNLYVSDDFGQAWSCRSTRLPTPSGVLIC